MPTVEITKEQAEALERGENITVEPQPKYHIAVHTDGATYLIHGPASHAKWKMLNGHHNSAPGYWSAWQSTEFDFAKSRRFTLVPIYPGAV